MHLGVIGGIGPAATVAYYRRLVQRFKDDGLALELTLSHADVISLSANAAAGRRQLQAGVFQRHLQRLEAAGCDVAIITALTGHFCLHETIALSPIPVLSAVDPIDAYCSAQGIKTLGLLGSPPVLATHLFNLLNAPRTVVPSGDLTALGATYLELAFSGHCTVAQRDALFDAGASMVKDQGADAVLLAGTDLGLAFDGQSPGYTVIDALDLHVEAILDHARAEATAGD